MKTMSTSFSRLLLAGILFGCFGCGQSSDLPEIASAKGVVKFKGKPLPQANILFIPDSGPVASGVTDEQGNFTLMTQGHRGAKIGNHRVTIQAIVLKDGVKGTAVDPESGAERSVETVSVVPEKYGNPYQSGLTATVASGGPNEFLFEIP
mgnify:CR=1 FL=1|jgi:hypothetical protein